MKAIYNTAGATITVTPGGVIIHLFERNHINHDFNKTKNS